MLSINYCLHTEIGVYLNNCYTSSEFQEVLKYYIWLFLQQVVIQYPVLGNFAKTSGIQ